jgi:hypothetical protein
MMRTNLQPLAHLVDAAAEQWVAAENAAATERREVREAIMRQFRIGDQPELTFHGLRYLLTISHARAGEPGHMRIAVHKIALNG